MQSCLVINSRRKHFPISTETLTYLKKKNMKQEIEMTNISFKIPISVKRNFEIICKLNHKNTTDFLLEKINNLIIENQDTLEIIGGRDVQL